jgi:hypothetical protein
VPDPLTLIHEFVVDADQLQPVPTLTLIVPVPPVPFIVRLVGVNEYVHVLAACVTVNVRPATVSVPVRCDVLVLGAMVKLAGPLPDPLAPAVTVIHVTLLSAVHAHPEVVVTVVEPLAPAAAADWLDGEIEKVQAAAFCVTVKVCPAISAVAVRDCVAVLAEALKFTVPLPLPVPALVSVSQALLLAAVQAQPEPAATLVDAVPPAATTVRTVGVSEKVQAAAT